MRLPLGHPKELVLICAEFSKLSSLLASSSLLQASGLASSELKGWWWLVVWGYQR
jgi:hypothetical protein